MMNDMMNKICALCFTVVLLLGATTVEAKDKIETTICADLVNQYIWRGQDLGSVAIQPTLGVAYKGLSLTAWGNVGFKSADAKEIDLTLAYNTGKLNIGITDYWVSKGGGDPEGRYFKYDAHCTNHVFEFNIGYDFGLASVQWFTNFAGNDGRTQDDKRAYSSYLEVNVPFKLVTVDWTATAGVVPYAAECYGTTGFAVTNLSLRATKDIKVTDSFSIPIFAQFIANPCAQKAYLVFGLTLQP